MTIFCNRCGQDNLEGSQFCSKCGQLLGASPMAGAPSGGTSPLNQGGSSFAPPQASVSTDPNAKTDGNAIRSLILGILSLTIFLIFLGIPAVILGHVSRSNIKKSRGKLKGEGVALAGLIMGYMSFLFMLVIMAIALPGNLRSKISANESAAVANLRTINTALVTYQATYSTLPATGAFNQLSDGGTPSNCPKSPESGSACLLDNTITAAETTAKSGYRFVYARLDSDGNQVPDGYFVVATPITPGSTGVRSFCSDQTGVIRYVGRGETCTAKSVPI